MTDPEMNAPAPKKMMRLCAVAGSVLILAACAARPAPAVTESSSANARVEALGAANRTYPRWRDFPRSPTDLPEPVEIAAQVNTLRATGGALAGEVSRIEWGLNDPAGFAASVTSRIEASKVAPISATTEADVEDFARRLRERATAPPPIRRR